MTSPSTDAENTTHSPSRQISVLLFSNDRVVRDSVRVAIGDHPADDVHITQWLECATAPAVLEAAHSGEYDVLILDGEAQPYGGLGITRQLKNEVFGCAPVLVLTGRPGDGWLATWSQADAVVPRPLDPARLTAAVVELARRPA